MSDKDVKMLSVSGLRERGWTQNMIASMLGEPDMLKRNPHYAKAAPMRLYNVQRVETAESEEEFITAKARSSSRAVGAKKAVETKRQALLRQVHEMTVLVEILPVGEVRRLAIEAYDDWNFDTKGTASPDAPKDFRDRITVNYIRHNLTTYDEALEEVAGRVGVSEAVQEIRRKIYASIADGYPSLKQECVRQMAKRGIQHQGGDKPKANEKQENVPVTLMAEACPNSHRERSSTE